MCKYFHPQTPSGCSIKIYTKAVLLCFEFELLKAQPCSFALHQRRVELGWIMTYLIFLPQNHAGLVYDVTDTASCA